MSKEIYDKKDIYDELNKQVYFRDGGSVNLASLASSVEKIRSNSKIGGGSEEESNSLKKYIVEYSPVVDDEYVYVQGNGAELFNKMNIGDCLISTGDPVDVSNEVLQGLRVDSYLCVYKKNNPPSGKTIHDFSTIKGDYDSQRLFYFDGKIYYTERYEDVLSIIDNDTDRLSEFADEITYEPMFIGTYAVSEEYEEGQNLLSEYIKFGLGTDKYYFIKDGKGSKLPVERTVDYVSESDPSPVSSRGVYEYFNINFSKALLSIESSLTKDTYITMTTPKAYAYALPLIAPSFEGQRLHFSARSIMTISRAGRLTHKSTGTGAHIYVKPSPIGRFYPYGENGQVIEPVIRIKTLPDLDTSLTYTGTTKITIKGGWSPEYSIEFTLYKNRLKVDTVYNSISGNNNIQTSYYKLTPGLPVNIPIDTDFGYMNGSNFDDIFVVTNTEEPYEKDQDSGIDLFSYLQINVGFPDTYFEATKINNELYWVKKETYSKLYRIGKMDNIPTASAQQLLNGDYILPTVSTTIALINRISSPIRLNNLNDPTTWTDNGYMSKSDFCSKVGCSSEEADRLFSLAFTKILGRRTAGNNSMYVLDSEERIVFVSGSIINIDSVIINVFLDSNHFKWIHLEKNSSLGYLCYYETSNT